MKNYYLYLILVIFFSSCKSEEDPFSPDFANEAIAERDEKVELVSSVVTKITSAEPSANFSELEVLDELAGTRIIGMGEASHGTREFFDMKHKMLRFFVEEHGYRGIIMEADFGECLKANEFVLHDIGTIDEVMSDMHFWTWRTEEVKNMIKWMHDYNLDKSIEDKIYYLGSDCQFTDSNLELFEDRISELPDDIENSLRTYSDRLTKNIFEVTELDMVEYNLSQADSLIQKIDFYQSEIETSTSIEEYEILLRLVEVTFQVLTSVENRILGESYNYRDLYMAENTLWWADHFQSDEKFLVWAHNFHVSTIDLNDSFGGSQGAHLRSFLNDDYKVIGFSMAVGSYNAVSNQQGLSAGMLPSKVEFSSLNDIFYLEENNNFIWVLNEDIKSNPVFEWFNNEREFMSVGAVHPTSSFYTNINIFSEYDVMIHFDISTPTELIQ